MYIVEYIMHVNDFNIQGVNRSGYMTHIWTTNRDIFDDIKQYNVDYYDSNMNVNSSFVLYIYVHY